MSPTLLPPAKSPEPEYDGAETPSGVYRAISSEVGAAWWHTKVQWGVVGAFLVGAGSFVTWSLNKLDLVNTAMAQSQVTTVATSDRTKVLEQRVEAIDAGMRAAIERLERKIDANNEQTDKKLDAVLREVRKK